MNHKNISYSTTIGMTPIYGLIASDIIRPSLGWGEDHGVTKRPHTTQILLTMASKFSEAITMAFESETNAALATGNFIPRRPSNSRPIYGRLPPRATANPTKFSTYCLKWFRERAGKQFISIQGHTCVLLLRYFTSFGVLTSWAFLPWYPCQCASILDRRFWANTISTVAFRYWVGTQLSIG